jgi:hypothetical protein
VLTSAQQLTFRTDVKAQGGAIAAAYAAKNTDALASIYNALSSPAYWIWRASVTKDEYVSGTGPAATTFSWTAYIARTQGERDAFKEIFTNAAQAVNPSLVSVRQAFADIFSGAPGATTRTHMTDMSRKQASKFGQLYGTGTGSTVSPATVPTELIDYVLTSQDAHDALFDSNGNPI